MLAVGVELSLASRAYKSPRMVYLLVACRYQYHYIPAGESLADTGRGDIASIPGVSVGVREGIPVYVTTPSMLRDVVKKILELGYDYLLSISGVDEPAKQAIRIVYHFTSTTSPEKMAAVEVTVSRQDPRVPSISDIIPAALFQEREEHEMLGIVFEGLPDTRHLLLPDDWPERVYPLRKDFSVDDEPITSQKPSKPLSILKGMLQGEGR